MAADPDDSGASARRRASEAPALQPGDSYWDGPYLVFTRQYHLRRGYCCDSGCRHCPYQPMHPDGRQDPHGVQGA